MCVSHRHAPAPGVSPRLRRNIVTTTPIPNNETAPEAAPSTIEEAAVSTTIAASEVPEHPFARIGEDGTVYVKDGD